jgi:hypothetical protein
MRVEDLIRTQQTGHVTKSIHHLSLSPACRLSIFVRRAAPRGVHKTAGTASVLRAATSSQYAGGIHVVGSQIGEESKISASTFRLVAPHSVSCVHHTVLACADVSEDLRSSDRNLISLWGKLCRFLASRWLRTIVSGSWVKSSARAALAR